MLFQKYETSHNLEYEMDKFWRTTGMVILVKYSQLNVKHQNCDVK